MPIYEYQCRNCQQRSEFLQKFSDPKQTDCPHCQQPTLDKLISATSFQLKGGGWYATDFRNPPKPKSSDGTGSTNDCGNDKACGTAAKGDCQSSTVTKADNSSNDVA